MFGQRWRGRSCAISGVAINQWRMAVCWRTASRTGNCLLTKLALMKRLAAGAGIGVSNLDHSGIGGWRLK